jgi:hypothetical protein
VEARQSRLSAMFRVGKVPLTTTPTSFRLGAMAKNKFGETGRNDVEFARNIHIRHLIFLEKSAKI